MAVQKRNPAVDIIRCLAFFCVVSVHFFLNNGYYLQTVEGTRMFVMTVMRSFFIVCVPLFIMLSGYLMRKKELSKKYYTKVFKVVVTYILASILCLLYSVIFLQEELTFKDMVLKILNFTADPYAWYIEMYLGLFLIIPFLNLLYNNIRTQKWKLGLIAVLLVLTSLPTLINVYNFSSVEWWAMPSSSFETSKLIPAWWTEFYPITYYFIGCYLSEYGLKIKGWLNVVLIVLGAVISGVYEYWRSYKSVFVWGAWNHYNSLFVVVISVLVFALFINLRYDKYPEKAGRFFGKISELCLGGYLLSWIFDSIFYPVLNQKVPLVQDRLEYYFVIVPLIVVLSLVLSYIVSKIQLLLEIIFAKLGGLIRKHKPIDKFV